jgi:adenylate cyclase
MNLEATRSRLRLGSALIMLAFVVCHLCAHAFLLISFAAADAALNLLMAPWRSSIGLALLAAAAAVHYANALWSIWLRRSLHLSRWEWWQLALGLCIPALLVHHVVSVRIAIGVAGFEGTYDSVLALQWLVLPWLAVLQAAAVIVVWAHAMIGLHFWLRTRPAYPQWRGAVAVAGLLLPTLALSGYVAAGNQVLRAAGAQAPAGMTDAMVGQSNRIAAIGWSLHLALALLPFAARGVRRMVERRNRPPLLTHAGGRTVPMLPGATVLETLREHGIPHAAVCGGRARCTTCRVLVTRGLDALPAPEALEAKALARIAATPGMRLACQIRPTADIAVTPLLAADASAADGTVRGGLEGRERLITVVFVDLRDSTALAEGKLPYDVLFLLNQFFHAMTQALAATNGHYSQFTGDGLMALYGLASEDPAAGAADAVRGAREMLLRLGELNRKLGDELAAPLRIGIGIHLGEAITGAMGPPRSQIISAIGDTVNTAARLESLTKDYDCALILSRRAAEAAGLDLGARDLHECAVKGRHETVQFYALKSVPERAR